MSAVRLTLLIALALPQVAAAQGDDQLSKQDRKRQEQIAKDSAKAVRDSIDAAKRVIKTAEKARKDSINAIARAKRELMLRPSGFTVEPMALSERPVLVIGDFDFTAMWRDARFGSRSEVVQALQAYRGNTREGQGMENSAKEGGSMSGGVSAMLTPIFDRSATFRMRTGRRNVSQYFGTTSAAPTAMLAPDVVLLGSVVEVSDEDKYFSAAGILPGIGGLLGSKKKNTVVKVTCELINRDEEAIATSIGEGLSDKGGGIVIAGGAAGGAGAATANETVAATMQAMERALQNCAAEIVNSRDNWLDRIVKPAPAVARAVAVAKPRAGVSKPRATRPK